ncbi:hypothetical protein AB9E19_33420, partial [Rhizobium leguminosarum]|uniref:hypothetical protein n=1 Tax=Rhizobium leguminosarum TaxID=384 RepID=UPI003F95424C
MKTLILHCTNVKQYIALRYLWAVRARLPAAFAFPLLLAMKSAIPASQTDPSCFLTVRSLTDWRKPPEPRSCRV